MILRVRHGHHYGGLAGQTMAGRLWAITFKWSLPKTVSPKEFFNPAILLTLGSVLATLSIQV